MAAIAKPVTSAAPPAALIDGVLRLAGRHLDRASHETRYASDITLAGFHIRLSSDDADLQHYAAPHFAHLAAASGSTPDLALCAVVDPGGLAAIGSALPAGTFAEPDRSTVIAGAGIAVSLHYGPKRNPILLNAYDGSKRRGVSIATSRCAAHHVQGIRPYLEILRWWSAGTPLVFAHAAGVGTAARGFLLVGPAATGKSSTSLAVSGRRLGFLGDDVVCIGPGPRVYSVYAAARLRPDMVSLFAEDQRWFAPGWYDWNGKPSQLFGGETLQHMLREAQLSAVVMPRKTNSLDIRPASTAAALRSLAPSTLATMAVGRLETLDKLNAALTGIPAFEFGIGPDLEAMRNVFEQFATKEEIRH